MNLKGKPLLSEDFEKAFGKISYMISQTPQVLIDFQLFTTNTGLLMVWDAVDQAFPEDMVTEMFEMMTGLVEFLSQRETSWENKLDFLSVSQQKHRDNAISFKMENVGNKTLIEDIVKKGNYFYYDGQLKRNVNTQNDWKGFESGWYYADYINAETIKVAKKLKVKEAHWINANIDQKQNEMLKMIAMECLKSSNQKKTDHLIQKVVDNSSVKTSWFRIACEMQGYNNKKGYLFLEFGDSYIVGAAVINAVINKLVYEKDSVGVVWAFEYIDPFRIMEDLTKHGIINKIILEFDNIKTTEEGEI